MCCVLLYDLMIAIASFLLALRAHHYHCCHTWYTVCHTIDHNLLSLQKLPTPLELALLRSHKLRMYTCTAPAGATSGSVMPSCFSLSSTTPVAIAKPLHPLLPLLFGFALASGWLSEPLGLVWPAEPGKEMKDNEIAKRDWNTYVAVRFAKVRSGFWQANA